ncbi:MAG: M3 family metallopeptidase, partial [Pseudomonadota bacterium]
SRGDNGDASDNNAIITELLKLRQERSRLLGYGTYAEFALEKRVAQNPDNAMDLLNTVWPAAIARVEEEVADMQQIADVEGAEIKIAPWDYRFYAEKVRKARYDLDFDEVKNYMQLDRLREGMFWMASELFDLTFTEVNDVAVFHPDVRVWTVTRGDDFRGLFYFDPFARTGKRSGAWLSTYRPQSKLDGTQTVIVSNNSNFIKGAPGDPVLISWSDATTLYHEFGHALHGLLSDVTYPGQCCTRVARDYVEFPSQVFENWLATPEILSRFALHYETGEPMPADLLERIKLAGTFNQGFATTEYLASALIDQKIHSLEDASNVDPDAFERITLNALGMPEELPMRHRTTQFSHVFASEAYAAQYYAYLWADTFSADAWEAFQRAPNGVWDRDKAAAFEAHILAVGDTVPPQIGYQSFRGSDPDVSALMRQRGFQE